jgi:hypothetical protein
VAGNVSFGIYSPLFRRCAGCPATDAAGAIERIVACVVGSAVLDAEPAPVQLSNRFFRMHPPPRPRINVDLLKQVDGAGDAGVHDVTQAFEVLVEEPTPRPVPAFASDASAGLACAAAQSRSTPSMVPRSACIELAGTPSLQKSAAARSIAGSSAATSRSKSFLAATFRQFVADAGGCSGYDGECHGL